MNGVGALIGLQVGTAMAIVISDPYPWHARRFTRRVLNALQPRSRNVPRVLGAHRVRSIEERQRLAGLRPDAAAHLMRLVVWTSSGIGVGTFGIAVLLGAGLVRNAMASGLLLVVCGVSGWMLCDRRLGMLAKRRQNRAALELPGIAQSLALAVAAGSGVPHAMERVAHTASGAIADELRVAIDQMRSGATLDATLAAIPNRLPVPSVQRFTDALRIALERGTPLVDVLHAQATDARAESRRLMMERAGRREAAMLIPIVFLVLPAIVVIALYPGFRELSTLT